MSRKPKQPFLPFSATELLPSNIVIVKTTDIDIHTLEGGRELLQRMRSVEMDKSILLDFLVGRKRGTPHHCEECAEYHRLQSLLNSRYRNKRFDFFGNSFTANLVREGIRQMPAILADIKLRVKNL